MQADPFSKNGECRALFGRGVGLLSLSQLAQRDAVPVKLNHG
jgi:hypothetical protein